MADVNQGKVTRFKYNSITMALTAKTLTCVKTSSSDVVLNFGILVPFIDTVQFLTVNLCHMNLSILMHTWKTHNLAMHIT